MKKSKIQICKSHIKSIYKALKFSNLDNASKTYVENELLYFNNRCVSVMGYIIMFLEAFNIINVLFFSKSGLESSNNRQYFTMYLLMFFCGILCLFVRELFYKRQKFLLSWYTWLALFFMVWHAILTSMDLRQNPNIIVYVTGTFVVAFLLRFKPRETFLVFPSGLLVLLIFSGSNISIGNIINTSTVTIVAILISCTRYLTTVEEMDYRKKMILQADHSSFEKNRLNLLQQQQQALLQHSKEILFIWDKSTDQLSFADNLQIENDDRNVLISYLKNFNENNENTLNFKLGNHNPATYYINITPQLDGNQKTIGAVGKLELYHKISE